MLGLKNPFDEAARERTAKCIASAFKKFSEVYLKNYTLLMVKKMVADSLDQGGDDEKNERQLLHRPKPEAPQHEGWLNRQTNVLKKWKRHYFSVTPDWDINFYTDEKKEKLVGTINPWNYRAMVFSSPDNRSAKRQGGPAWVPDEERPECAGCKAKFSALNRRHHCRSCGDIYCGNCAPNKVALDHFGYEKPQLVCNECFSILSKNDRRISTAPLPQGLKGDEKEDKFYGIKLIGKDRKGWYLSCDSQEEQTEWLAIFKQATSKAKAPVNKDKLKATAFKKAYLQAYWDAGWWYWFRVTGTESEMISELIYRIVDYEILSDVYGQITGSPKARNIVSKLIRSNVLVMINVAVEAGWMGAQAALDAAKEPVQKAVKPLIEPIGKAKADMMKTVQEKTMDKINPIMEENAVPVLEKIFDVVLKPISAALALLFKAFKEHASKLADALKGKKSAKEIESGMSGTYRSARGGGAALKGAVAQLASLREALKVLDKLPVAKFVSPSGIIAGLVDSCQTLMQDAFYTFEKDEQFQKDMEADADVGKAVTDTVGRVLPKLLNDTQVEVKNMLKHMLAQIILPALKGSVLSSKPILAITEPLDAALPDNIKEFLTVSDTLEELVENIVGETIANAVDKSAEPTLNQLSEEMAAITA